MAEAFNLGKIENLEKSTRRLFRISEIANLCGVKVQTVYSWLKKGLEHKRSKNGKGHIAIYRNDLRKFLRATENKGQQKAKGRRKSLNAFERNLIFHPSYFWDSRIDHVRREVFNNNYKVKDIANIITLYLIKNSLNNFYINIKSSPLLKGNTTLFDNKKNMEKCLKPIKEIIASEYMAKDVPEELIQACELEISSLHKENVSDVLLDLAMEGINAFNDNDFSIFFIRTIKIIYVLKILKRLGYNSILFSIKFDSLKKDLGKNDPITFLCYLINEDLIFSNPQRQFFSDINKALNECKVKFKRESKSKEVGLLISTIEFLNRKLEREKIGGLNGIPKKLLEKGEVDQDNMRTIDYIKIVKQYIAEQLNWFPKKFDRAWEGIPSHIKKDLKDIAFPARINLKNARKQTGIYNNSANDNDFPEGSQDITELPHDFLEKKNLNSLDIPPFLEKFFQKDDDGEF